jgi:hypothetical protein
LCFNVQPVFFPTASLGSFSCTSGGGGNNTISFGQDVTAAAVALQSNTEAMTFTALLDGVFVESFTTTTTLSVLPSLSHASDFYGFTGIVFDELSIANGSGIYQIDNLQFSNAVPEPSSVMLVGLALAALMTRRPRKK